MNHRYPTCRQICCQSKTRNSYSLVQSSSWYVQIYLASTGTHACVPVHVQTSASLSITLSMVPSTKEKKNQSTDRGNPTVCLVRSTLHVIQRLLWMFRQSLGACCKASQLASQLERSTCRGVSPAATAHRYRHTRRVHVPDLTMCVKSYENQKTFELFLEPPQNLRGSQTRNLSHRFSTMIRVPVHVE